uniref:RecA family profile 1 domain-containing protein n=1 Tax=Sphaeramia orbicularis TaxID=375764 RepID=A0A673AQ30_9TELE
MEPYENFISPLFVQVCTGQDTVHVQPQVINAVFVFVQLFARLEARRCLKDIEPRLFPKDGGPNHGEVVELFGPEGTGKTEVLYHLLSRCILPVAAGGLEVDVVFVDTDYSLDMLRLVSILDNKLNPGTLGTLHSCLSRLLVVHCSSSSQLLLTLHFLETTLSSRPGLALLLIDSVSAFYWLDRSEGGASVAKQEEKLSKCSELLGRLLRDYRITMFATCHAIRRSHAEPSSSSSSSSNADRPFLCRSWQRLVTHRLIFSRREDSTNIEFWFCVFRVVSYTLFPSIFSFVILFSDMFFRTL